MWLSVAWQSLLNRKVSSLLTLLALMVSVSLLFAIEHIRTQTQENFKRTVSGIDLVVAARSSQINVLLSSVFRIGANPNSVSWSTYQNILQDKNIVWGIPLALGDSFQGFPVVGTTPDYFEYYKFGNKQTLQLQHGRVFMAPNEAVIGANVARRLNLNVGQEIVVSHGSGKVSFTHHDHHPMLITGILAPTGTPVDKSLHVPLKAITEMHKAVVPPSGSAFARPSTNEPTSLAQEASHKHDHARHQVLDIEHDKEVDKEHDDEHSHEHDHGHNDAHQLHKPLPSIAPGQYDLIGQPEQISAFMLNLASPFAILTLQRDLNKYPNEAISAIMPQVALSELWQIIGNVESILQLIAWLVLFSSLVGLVTMLLTSMHERRNEISVLRAIGAGPLFIASLVQVEAILISLLAIVGAYFFVSVMLWLTSAWLLSEYGLFVSAHILSFDIAYFAVIIVVLTVIVACVPTLLAYRDAKFLFR